MKALILAAGFGTRLRPFTNTMPKALVPVNGIPLILYILAFLKHNHVSDVVINLHHLGEHIPKFLGSGKKFGFNISYSHEPKILGTGGGIKKALRYFKDDALIINGDVIADFSLKKMIKQHQSQKDFATLSLYDHPNKNKFGLLYYKKNKLTSILGTPEPAADAENAMFASYHILSKKQALPHFRQFKANTQFCIMRHVYIPQIQNQKNFGAFVTNGYWTVCDSMEDVKKAEQDLNKKGFKLSYQKELDKLAKMILKK